MFGPERFRHGNKIPGTRLPLLIRMSETFADLTHGQRMLLATLIAPRWRDVSNWMGISPQMITSGCVGGEAAAPLTHTDHLIDTLATMRTPIASFASTLRAAGYPGLIPTFMTNGSVSIAKPVPATTPTPEPTPAADKLLITIRGMPRLHLESAISVFCETLMATTGHTVNQIASAIPGGLMAPRKIFVAEYFSKLVASGMTLAELAGHLNTVRTHHPDDAAILAATQQALDLIGYAPARVLAPVVAPSTAESSSSSSDTSCVVCIDAPRAIALAPCGHLCLCVTCSSGISTCPVCCHAVTSVLRIYSP